MGVLNVLSDLKAEAIEEERRKARQYLRDQRALLRLSKDRPLLTDLPSITLTEVRIGVGKLRLRELARLAAVVKLESVAAELEVKATGVL